ncbi:hypothetical protein HMPREF9078_01317 [Capnocytophaga sp. oral taxon 380 str. F0488]|nr:hypothetical protein HMPREF9078_01317 [Capnocytophaga sp. oral taxon 380 str. F0488]
MALQWVYSGSTVALQWVYSGSTVGLHRTINSLKPESRWAHLLIQ